MVYRVIVANSSSREGLKRLAKYVQSSSKRGFGGL